MVTDPVEVFQEVRDARPSTANWVVPLILGAIAGLVFVLVAFSQPAVLEQMTQLQLDAIDQQVQRGAMKAAAAEGAKEQIERMRPMMAGITMVFGGVGAVVGTFAFGFAAGFALWLLAQYALKAPVSFWKCMEVVGLSQVVALFNTAISLMIVVYRGSITVGPNAALLAPQVKPGSPLFTLLGAFNPFMIWWVVVLALGLAVLTRKAWTVTLGWLLGLYGVIFLGLAAWARVWH